MPLYDDIINQRGSFERLVARIPGFRGYQEKQARRTADRMLRDYVAEQIQKRIDRFGRLEKRLLDNTGLKYMSKSRDLKGRMQLYHDKVSTATPGYDGMWAQMKIEAQNLEEIYSFDEAQIRYIEKFDPLLDQLEAAITAGDGIDAAMMRVDGAATDALDAFRLRDDVFAKLSQN